MKPTCRANPSAERLTARCRRSAANRIRIPAPRPWSRGLFVGAVDEGVGATALSRLPGNPPREIDAEAAARQLARPDNDPATFVWLHFALANAASKDWLCDKLKPPNSFRETLAQAVGSTRLEQEDDALVAVIHDVEFDFSFDPSAISTVNLWIRPGLAISARLKPLRSLDRLRAAIKAGATFRSPAELLGRLLSEQANVLVEIVRKATDRVDIIEDQLLVERLSPSRGELGNLRRTLVRLQLLLAPEPAVFFRLLSRPPGWIARPDVDDLRQAAEEFSAAVSGCADLGAPGEVFAGRDRRRGQ